MSISETSQEEDEGVFAKLSIPNISIAVINDIAYSMAKISKRDVRTIKDTDIVRFSISFASSFLKPVANDLEAIEKKQPGRIRAFFQAVDQMLDGSWREDTKWSVAKQRAREKWIQRQEKEAVLRTFGGIFEFLRQMSSSDLQSLADRMELNLSSIPVKPDERGKYQR
jgi:hypothetical protein